MNALLLTLALVCQVENPPATGEPALAGRFRVGIVTMKGTPWELEDNFGRMENYVRQAASDKAKVVITPENVLDGYVCAADPYTTRARMLKVAQPIPEGPYVVRARKLARELDIYLVFGFLELVDKDMYNTCVLISPQGRIIAKYSKVRPKFESHIRAGRKLAPFDTPLGRVGFLICSDRYIGANYPPLRAAGTQLIFLPMDGTPNATHLKQRARETGSWIIVANTRSALVIDSMGKVLMEHYNKEGVHVQDVDLSTATAPVMDRPALNDVEVQRLVMKAFEATQRWWDSEGHPTQLEIEDRKKSLESKREALVK